MTQNHRYIRRTEYDANLEVVTDLRNQLLERALSSHRSLRS